MADRFTDGTTSSIKNIEVPGHVTRFLEEISKGDNYTLEVELSKPFAFRWGQKNISWWAEVNPEYLAPFWIVISYFPEDGTIIYRPYSKRDDSETNVINSIDNRVYLDPEDPKELISELDSDVERLQEAYESWEDGDGLNDGLAGFDEKQINKIKTLNTKLASLDSVLGFKYRVYCAKNDEGYVLKRYAISCDVGNSAGWTDILARFKPIGMGKVGRQTWFPKKHGVSWSFITENAKADIEKKVQAYMNKNEDAAAVVEKQKKKTVKTSATKPKPPKAATAAKKKSAPARQAAKPAARPAPTPKPSPVPAGAATEADLDNIEKSIDDLAKLIQQSIK